MCKPERVPQRGSSKLNLLLVLVILGAIIFAVWKIIPPYIANYQLQDAMESESRFALNEIPKKTADDIREDVWQKVKELGVPAKREDIKVSVISGQVDISLDYTVPISLAVYQFDLSFHPHADNHTL